MMEDAMWFEIIGLLGVFFYIGSYGALQMDRLDGNSLLYSALNATAAILVLVSLTKNFNLASALIQIIWISISLAGACRLLVSTPNQSTQRSNKLAQTDAGSGIRQKID